ncbi:hypothetical protein [Sphingopyxis sp. 22461]|uniref:hypothetical protein n=1 Tax=Sphingopyxis sp. 22461 TaxID=3453923 RepID=UPI003F860B32
MAKTFTVEVRQIVEVELDEIKFDDAFMEEFRDSQYPFMTLADHAEHIAQLQARGVYDLDYIETQFVEGYGPANEMGIKARVIGTEMEVLRMPEPESAA